MHLEVIVTLICPYCPKTVRLAHRPAFLNESACGDKVVGAGFARLAQRYHVHGVPRTAIHGRSAFEGALNPIQPIVEIPRVGKPREYERMEATAREASGARRFRDPEPADLADVAIVAAVPAAFTAAGHVARKRAEPVSLGEGRGGQINDIAAIKNWPGVRRIGRSNLAESTGIAPSSTSSPSRCRSALAARRHPTEPGRQGQGGERVPHAGEPHPSDSAPLEEDERLRAPRALYIVEVLEEVIMLAGSLSRRHLLEMLSAAPATAALQSGPLPGDADRERRMKWWHEAKFGMFIHWGLYSLLGRHEWVMENEGIPVAEYEQLAEQFRPKPAAAREWARLARRAGQRYMVMTTKHHEGFCLFDSKLTDYCATKRGPKRDLVAEYVEAARAEGLRVGFYYSLMDWHHPDGARCATDEAARKRFVEYIHGQIRELLTNYGKIDILWYDVAWPLDAEGWESVRMNEMVFKLQPDIVVNNRNRLPGDFSTPEQRIQAEKPGRAWEACMTMNDSWGYHAADDNWKSPKTCVRQLIQCARDGGNYLLNIGPRGDGSVPEESVRILGAIGRWTERNGQAIYGAERCQVTRSNYASFTRKGNTLYMHVYFWPGETVTLAGLESKVLGAKLLATGKPVRFQQDEFRVRFTGLPETPPDDPVTVIAIECDREPVQNTDRVRRERPRRGV